ncbi:major facilitator superfamily transporter protein [Apiospora saccharicola]|uniref:Major facilitator superfamily transporter protein n=1 Tax=Apiospora saccharicola TaxID=335842 RepID=A0ABR1ULX8_9PEZI
MTATTDERSPLLPEAKPSKKQNAVSRLWSRIWSTPNRVVFAGFLITMSFSVTQVPLFYMFHIMECDVFYTKHPPFEGIGDRCARNEIAAGTATQFSILGMSTTLCGTLNLFFSGWLVKRYGPRLALMLQTTIPRRPRAAADSRRAGRRRGGHHDHPDDAAGDGFRGPAGYILVVNTIAGEVVQPLQRTALFGKLQGMIMLGMSLGLWVGGMIGDRYGIQSPFLTAFCLFCFASVYARTTLPYISPESLTDGKKSNTNGVSGFLAPLKVLAPQRLQLHTGQIRKHYGVFFLCCGIFLGVVATGYAPILIQMYATAEFGFDQADNGYLMAGNALMRAFFLIVIFPRIIAAGRKWFARSAILDQRKNNNTANQNSSSGDPETPPTMGEIIPTDPRQFEIPSAGQAEEEPVAMPEITDPAIEKLASQFDLLFLRWSLVVDGLLTAMTAFATQGWHVYIAAFILPFGSGSAPAAKGVITEMCPKSQRADALNAVTLVENIARLATLGLFGFVFAALSEIGKSYLTFFCNAAVAVLGMGVLLFSHFPPNESTLVEEEHDDDNENCEVAV